VPPGPGYPEFLGIRVGTRLCPSSKHCLVILIMFSDCFSWFGINSTIVGKLTETAQTFLNMSELFLSCVFNESIVYNLQVGIAIMIFMFSG